MNRINLGMAVNYSASIPVIADRLEQLTKDLVQSWANSALRYISVIGLARLAIPNLRNSDLDACLTSAIIMDEIVAG